MSKRVLVVSVLLLGGLLLFALGYGAAERCDARTPSRLLGRWERPGEIAWVTIEPHGMTYGFRDLNHPWEESIGLCYLGTTDRPAEGGSDTMLYEDVFGALGGEDVHYFPRLVIVNSVVEETSSSKPSIQVQWCSTASELRHGWCHEEKFECLHGECLTSRSTRPARTQAR